MAEEPQPGDEEAYTSLRRLIPQLAEELDGLRASLREHNVWLQRYGSAPASAPHQVFSSTSPYNPAVATGAHSSTRQPQSNVTNEAESSTSPSPSQSQPKTPPNYLVSSTTDTLPSNQTDTNDETRTFDAALSQTPAATHAIERSANDSSSPYHTHTVSEIIPSQLPAYPAPPPAHQSTPFIVETDGLPAYGNTSPPPPPFLQPPPDREEMAARRDQTAEWLREGEDVLREYSARFAQLGTLLQRPFEDVLGSWQGSHPDNALPDYERVEDREELMVGGVGEVPPPYVGGGGSSTRESRDISHEDGESQSEDVAESDQDGAEAAEYGDGRDIINATRRNQTT